MTLVEINPIPKSIRLTLSRLEDKIFVDQSNSHYLFLRNGESLRLVSLG